MKVGLELVSQAPLYFNPLSRLHSVTLAVGPSGDKGEWGLECGPFPRHLGQCCAVETTSTDDSDHNKDKIMLTRANIFKCLPPRYMLGTWHVCPDFCLTTLIK